MVAFAQQVIIAARNGEPLPSQALEQFIRGLADGSTPAYQASAFLMAVYLKGLSPADTTQLTQAMRDSGQCVDLSASPLPKVDKHSTGGVGDKTSLILAPWVAACGALVPMVAGRGLGQTGGTLDKLESIPGFRVDLDVDSFRHIVTSCGAAIIGQTATMAPADRVLYGLRDVTGTVESIPLIVASILSKKLSEGIDALVLDVKVGRGAFMKTEAEARALAQALGETARALGLRLSILLTRMDVPLGRCIGNALEVREAIEVLQGRGPRDTQALCLALATEMLRMAGVAPDESTARQKLLAAQASGAALARFRQMVVSQGGSVHAIDDVSLLPQARHKTPISSARGGIIVGFDAYALGHLAMDLGAGRATAEDPVDPAVGIELLHDIGQTLQPGEPWAIAHHQSPLVPPWLAALDAALELSEEAAAQKPLILAQL